MVRSLGADEVVDYKKQEFEKVLSGYDAVLGTVRGDAIEKSVDILKPRGTIVSLVGRSATTRALRRRAAACAAAGRRRGNPVTGMPACSLRA